jgi:hypothetical protein
MTNYQFIQAYIELQKDIMFDELFDLNFATVCYSRNDPSTFWNNALVNKILTKEEVEKVASKFVELERKPALYYENRTDLASLTSLLTQLGYSNDAEDSWMFHSGENIDSSRFGSVKKVTTDKDLETFLTTFDKCYRKDDPLNPYGELGEYLKAAHIAWERHHDSNRIEYFIAYKGEEPVAVSTLTNHKGIGYISNVGSLLSVRGEGYGKLATMYCVSKSKENGNTSHCLATEEGTNPNKFYNGIGFTTRFTSKLMVKTQNQ